MQEAGQEVPDELVEMAERWTARKARMDGEKQEARFRGKSKMHAVYLEID